ncbi:MAG: sugar ABC transporter substrate-binding protein [Saccharofermentanales bacterium]|jgi:ribose transport system substrate-binding protein
MKRILALVLVIVMSLGLVACGGSDDKKADTSEEKEVKTEAGEEAAEETEAKESSDGKIKIGVSIWSSTDTLGSQCKRILDEAAAALDVEIMYVDQAHISEQVTASAETLAAAGCDGIVICNSASAEMTSVINTANDNEMYVAQFFRSINQESNPAEYELAKSSPYYVGAVHEDEVSNGATLVNILAEKGARKIGLLGWEAGDATFLGRWEGYKKGVEEWNAANADDPVELLEPQYGGTTSDTGRATTEAIINANPDIDSLIAAGGGGDTLVGALAAIDSLGLKGKIQVVSTDFLPDLKEQLESGGMSAESGGHFSDPLFAFLMVYNAIRGEYEVPTDGFYDILFPYIFVASVEDYADYDKYFVETLPYTQEEIAELADMSFEDLETAASKLSIEDAAERHAK